MDVTSDGHCGFRVVAATWCVIVENLEKEEKVVDDKKFENGVMVKVDGLGDDDCSVDLEAN